jgi:hypothetical protein
MRKDVGQVGQSLGINLNASRDRSIRVRALNQQASHGTLPIESFVKVTSQSELGGPEIGSDYGKIKWAVVLGADEAPQSD